MSSCGSKVGFFALRECPNPATAFCTACGRPMCLAHTSSTGDTCRDCWALQQQDTGPAAQEDDAYDDDWVFSYRRSHYRSGYTPAEWTARSRGLQQNLANPGDGTEDNDPLDYDGDDARSFVATDSDWDDDDDDARAGFGDS